MDSDDLTPEPADITCTGGITIDFGAVIARNPEAKETENDC